MLSTVVSPVRHNVVGVAHAAGPLETPEGMRRRARGVALSIALAAVAFLVAAPADAAPTKVSWPVFISVKAAPHTNNNIRMFWATCPSGFPL
jgi:hypothetical protein